MLPQQHRLVKKKDFELVFNKGESVKSGFLLVKLVKNNLSENRFGFVVSKKISTKATVRNKVKRRLRDAVDSRIKELKKPADVVVIALSGIEKKDFLETKKMLLGGLKKIGIL